MTQLPLVHPEPVEHIAYLEALIAAVKHLATPDFERFKVWFRGYCGA